MTTTMTTTTQQQNNNNKYNNNNNNNNSSSSSSSNNNKNNNNSHWAGGVVSQHADQRVEVVVRVNRKVTGGTILEVVESKVVAVLQLSFKQSQP